MNVLCKYYAKKCYNLKNIHFEKKGRGVKEENFYISRFPFCPNFARKKPVKLQKLLIYFEKQ